MARCQVCASELRDYVDGQLLSGLNPHRLYNSLPPDSVSLSALYRHARNGHHAGGSLVSTTPPGELLTDHLARALSKIENLEQLADSARKRGNVAVAVRADIEVARLSLQLAGSNVTADVVTDLESAASLRQAIVNAAHRDPEAAAAFLPALAAVSPEHGADWSQLVKKMRQLRDSTKQNPVAA